MAWPIKHIYGANIDPSLVGPRQVPSNPTSKTEVPPIEIWKWARNSKPVDAILINQLCEAANQAILYRTKEVFHAHGISGLAEVVASGGAGDRARWRFAFHTGVYSHALMAVVVMAPQDSGFTTNSKCRIDIANGAGAVVGTATFTYGTNPGGTTAVMGWQYLKPMQQMIEGLSPDTDYYGTIYDVDNGRTLTASVFELQSMSENFDGYMPTNITAESSILDVYRERLQEIIYNQWRRGAATVLNWTVDVQSAPRTIAVNTATNLIDGTSTTYSAAIPGYKLDMTNKARLSQTTGVPVVMKAYGTQVAPSSAGRVYLKDSAGTTVLTITGFVPTASWQSASGVLPATDAKYYLAFDDGGGGTTVSVYAVSLYQYE